ncbi:MAG: hypothetical protein QW561_05020 [Candidatus Aenigmatarchaeota archaeon]
MPGVYDIGYKGVGAYSFVDIEGSGENSTIIRTKYAIGFGGTIYNAEIRQLRIEVIGDGTFDTCYGMRIFSNDSRYDLSFENNPLAAGRLTNVTVYITGCNKVNNAIDIFVKNGPVILTNVTAIAAGGIEAKAISIGGYYSSALGIPSWDFIPSFTNVTAIAQNASINYGIYVAATQPVFKNITAKAIGGDNNYGIYIDYEYSNKPIRIHHSEISASTSSVVNGVSVWTGIQPLTFITNTLLEGGPISGIGNTVCAGVVDENYAFYPTTCP